MKTFLLVLIFVPFVSISQTKEELLEKGINASMDDHFAEAESYLAEYVKLDTTNSTAYCELAYAKYKVKTGDGMKEASRAIELDSTNSLAYEIRGWCYETKDRYDLALQEFNKAYELNPIAQYQYMIAYAYNGMEKYPESMEILNTMIADSTNDFLARAYNLRGLVYCSIEQYNLAILDFNNAIDHSIGIPNPYILLSTIYDVMNRRVEAHAIIQRCLSDLDCSAWDNCKELEKLNKKYSRF